jgi:hypothetical protein
MGWYRMLERQKCHYLRFGVVAGELETVVLGGHSQVVSAMQARCARGSDRLGAALSALTKIGIIGD